jgi:hypothetical protein
VALLSSGDLDPITKAPFPAPPLPPAGAPAAGPAGSTVRKQAQAQLAAHTGILQIMKGLDGCAGAAAASMTTSDDSLGSDPLDVGTLDPIPDVSRSAMRSFKRPRLAGMRGGGRDQRMQLQGADVGISTTSASGAPCGSEGEEPSAAPPPPRLGNVFSQHARPGSTMGLQAVRRNTAAAERKPTGGGGLRSTLWAALHAHDVQAAPTAQQQQQREEEGGTQDSLDAMLRGANVRARSPSPESPCYSPSPSPGPELSPVAAARSPEQLVALGGPITAGISQVLRGLLPSASAAPSQPDNDEDGQEEEAWLRTAGRALHPPFSGQRPCSGRRLAGVTPGFYAALHGSEDGDLDADCGGELDAPLSGEQQRVRGHCRTPLSPCQLQGLGSGLQPPRPYSRSGRDWDGGIAADLSQGGASAEDSGSSGEGRYRRCNAMEQNSPGTGGSGEHPAIESGDNAQADATADHAEVGGRGVSAPDPMDPLGDLSHLPACAAEAEAVLESALKAAMRDGAARAAAPPPTAAGGGSGGRGQEGSEAHAAMGVHRKPTARPFAPPRMSGVQGPAKENRGGGPMHAASNKSAPAPSKDLFGRFALRRG